MAHHLPPVGWLLQHRFVPEVGGHGQQSQGDEEIVCFLKHPSGCPALQTEGALPKLGTDCVPQQGRVLGEGQAEGMGSKSPSPRAGPSLPCALGPSGGARVSREDRCKPALSWPPWHPSWGLKGREPPNHRCWTRSVPTCSLETGRGRDRRDRYYFLNSAPSCRRGKQIPVLLIVMYLFSFCCLQIVLGI